MTTGRMAWIYGFTLAAAGGLSACSKPASPSSDLSRDLDAASSAPALTLAPTSGRRDVISAVERSPDARQSPAPSRRQVIRRSPPLVPPPVQMAAQTPQPTPATTVAAVPAQAAPPTVRTGQSPRPVPVSQAHGRYKTEAEVFRDAPFPITP